MSNIYRLALGVVYEDQEGSKVLRLGYFIPSSATYTSGTLIELGRTFSPLFAYVPLADGDLLVTAKDGRICSIFRPAEGNRRKGGIKKKSKKYPEEFTRAKANPAGKEILLSSYNLLLRVSKDKFEETYFRDKIIGIDADENAIYVLLGGGGIFEMKPRKTSRIYLPLQRPEYGEELIGFELFSAEGKDLYVMQITPRNFYIKSLIRNEEYLKPIEYPATASTFDKNEKVLAIGTTTGNIGKILLYGIEVLPTGYRRLVVRPLGSIELRDAAAVHHLFIAPAVYLPNLRSLLEYSAKTCLKS